MDSQTEYLLVAVSALEHASSAINEVLLISGNSAKIHRFTVHVRRDLLAPNFTYLAFMFFSASFLRIDIVRYILRIQII